MKTIICSIFLVLLSELTIAQHKPVAIFEKLWSTFDERYASFEIREINWNNIHDKYVSQVHDSTSENELYKICCHMLKELDDSHVNLYYKNNGVTWECNATDFPDSTSIYKSFSQERIEFYRLVDSNLMVAGFDSVKTSSINSVSYTKSNEYGYIRISQMDRINQKALNKALLDLNDSQGIIIDLRLNIGGTPVSLYNMAGRFADKKRLGHYKQTRIRGKQKFTPLKAFYLKSKGKFQFTHPICILTSNFTVSAAETFILAMKELPYVTIIGDTTNGAMSSKFKVKINKHFTTTLSIQKTYSASMKNFEGLGIPPDIYVSNEDAYRNSKDQVLVKALEVLSSSR